MCDSIINSKLKNEKGPWALNTHLVYEAFNSLDPFTYTTYIDPFQRKWVKVATSI